MSYAPCPLVAPRRFVAAALCCLVVTAASAEEAAPTTKKLAEESTLRFATKDEAAEFLGAEDEFTRSLSPTDRRIRMQAESDPGDEAFREFAAEAARDWTSEEVDHVGAAWDRVKPKLDGFLGELPEEVLLVRTSGAEESHAAYTRRNGIVLPDKVLSYDSRALAKLLAHELFHVFSRHHSAARWELYRLIGFEPCPLGDVAGTLAERKITNPDAPLWNCRIEIGKPGEEVDAVPVLLARTKDGKVQTTGTLFQIMEFKLLLVEKTEEGDAWRPRMAGDRPLIVDPASVPTFAEKIGANTRYVIHPDEIMAENFVHAIFDSPGLPDPEIVAGLRKILWKAP